MNRLIGHIESIKVNKSLIHVRVRLKSTSLSAIVIDSGLDLDYLKLGSSVQAIFKETELIIGKGVHHAISLQNKLVGKIHHIENGEILSKVTVNTEEGLISSIITVNAVKQLELKVGTEVTAMIKTNEMMISSC